MATCEICGKKTEEMFRVETEGTQMSVCKKCTSYGKVLSRVVEFKPRPVEKKIEKPEIEEIVVKDYWQKLRNAREKIEMSQEDFAKKINLKLSVLRSMESNKLIPDLQTAKRLEREIGAKLVEEQKVEPGEFTGEKGGAVTLGDIIEIKRRKK